MNALHAPELTVVVPTRDRAASLARCLLALEDQAGPSFEIVVIDDASVDPDAVAAVVARAPHARVVRADGRGPAAARNRGAAAARAPYVCFTDDDCRPSPTWLAALRAGFDAGAQVVAGPTRVADPRDRFAVAAQTITNALVDASRGPEVGTVGFAPTSNLGCAIAVHRDLPFDEDYPLAAGEDRAWCDDLAARGIAIAYLPDAWVDHAPILGLRGFWRQQVRYGRGAHRYHRRSSATHGATPRRFHLDVLRAGAASGPRVGGLVALAQAATAVGYAREAFAQAGSSRGSPGRSG